MKPLPWSAPGATERYNNAIMANRLFADSCTRDELCAVCGEPLHPFPEPTYWMQYPLPECCLIDGLKIHGHDAAHGRHDCIHRYLAAHPTLGSARQLELFS
ncbi:MAG TPA: hypothetical protein VN629_06940, partial [Castellaniella sp.]|nr:hypothetical protein [Castellaniella sp.]